MNFPDQTFKLLVDGTYTLREVLESREWAPLGARQGIDDVLTTTELGEVEIHFFYAGWGSQCGDDVLKHYDSRGLKPIDPATLALFMKKIEEKNGKKGVDWHTTGTIWKNASDEWCHIVFCPSMASLKPTGYGVFSGDCHHHDALFWAGIKK